MSQLLTTPISSTNAIKSTITADALVFRWFLYLLSREKAKSDLASDGAVYVQLKKTIITQNLCSIVMLAVLFYIFLTQQFIVLLAAAIIMFVYFKLQKAVREHVALLSLKIIAKHFKPDDVGHHTLYQIGERLANQYHVKSLVMSMTSVDIIIRRTVLYAIIFAAFIFPLNFLPFWGFVLAIYWVTYTIINTSPVYSHLS